MKMNFKQQISKFSSFVLVSLSIIFFITVMQSCDKDEYDTSISDSEAILIATDYLVLNNNQYELSLSRSEALSKGITNSQYDKFLFDIETTNTEISKIMSDPLAKINLSSPKQTKVDYYLPRLKQKSENSGSPKKITGFINISNVFGGSASWDIERDYKTIVCEGGTTCLIHTINLTLTGGGSTLHGSIVGGLAWTNSCTFTFPTTPGHYTLSGTTICSGGASVGYSIQ